MLAPKKSARQEKACAKSAGESRLYSAFDDAGRENSAYSNRIAR
jgi:hypothetical protein